MRFESDTSFPRPVWGMRDSMSNETDGFNKILNGLQIALYLLRFVFDHPSKTVFDSARGSTRAANSIKISTF